MEKQYSTFTVKTDIESEITMANYTKNEISIYKGRRLVEYLTPWFLSLDGYQAIFSGDEKAAKEAINDYINSMKRDITRIENLMAE